jgi:hypothetical protein
MDPIAEEHQMPSVEAMLAGTLALMTGYSQYLQAAINPAHRLCMGEKITQNLALLSRNPLLSDDCRCVLSCLRERWEVMANCTLEAGSACTAPRAPDDAFTLRAPTILQ